MITLENSSEIEKINNQHIFINEGYNLHFWGNVSLLILIKGRFHFRLTKVQTDILEKCTGLNTVEEIVNKSVEEYNGTVEQIRIAKNNIKKFLYDMVRKKFLSVSDKPNILCGKHRRFSGERGKYYPYDLSIELTSRCNFNCSFCYKRSGLHGNDINFDLLQEIRHIAAGKIKEIRLMGGEPTIYPYFQDVINALSNDFLLSIVTNGSVLYKYPIDSIKKIDNIQISLYGYSPESYKNNTGSAGWHNVQKSIEKANAACVDIKGCVTLSRDAIENFEKYIIGAIELGLKRLSFGYPSPAGRAQDSFNSAQSCRFTNDDLTYIYKLMREMMFKYESQINLTVWQHGVLKKEKENVAFDECSKCLDCGAGWYSLVVSEEGHIRPCELLDDKIFDYGDFSAITSIINGYFFEKELSMAIPQFEESISDNGVCLNDICPTLERYKQKNHILKSSL